MNLLPIYIFLSFIGYIAWIAYAMDFWFEKSKGKSWGFIGFVTTVLFPIAVLTTIAINHQ